MIMTCFFCVEKFKFNTIKYNTVGNICNKAVSIFSISLINIINILIRITKRLFK
ncbi:hypothetical protein Ctaglu_19410 [Clostridium tagluense]|uniref:Uncharacterized protein n=1 Tax=Clostridium tagluense TaxID=360422 RepID=A0A401UL95_9CLOT|nr:hypothetical protein Ctaglu_19410 [Clostridium tagluense]